MLRHFWIVSGWQRYFWISVLLTNHYKKCPVMWTIIELISKNPEISLSSRNNPEMSQNSLDVPIVVKFSIYIFPWDLLWTGWYHLKYMFLHWVQCFSLYQNSLKNRKCLNFLMSLQGVKVLSTTAGHTITAMRDKSYSMKFSVWKFYPDEELFQVLKGGWSSAKQEVYSRKFKEQCYRFL